MKKGKVKSYSSAAGEGVIKPDDDSAEVFFLRTVVQGGGVPRKGAAVEYELKTGSGEPRAKKVILV
jgi:cold shock CspA family protein